MFDSLQDWLARMWIKRTAEWAPFRTYSLRRIAKSMNRKCERELLRKKATVTKLTATIAAKEEDFNTILSSEYRFFTGTSAEAQFQRGKTRVFKNKLGDLRSLDRIIQAKKQERRGVNNEIARWEKVQTLRAGREV